jgi:hypothetical protein
MDPIGKVTATLVAQNTFSDKIAMHKGGFTFTLSGIDGDTVYLQRSEDAGTNWIDYASFTADGVFAFNENNHNSHYRFGVKTGGYSAGTIIGRISY